MKSVRRIAAVVIGLVFFGAGMLKLSDPVGAGLAVEEYFKFLHIVFLMPLAKGVAVAMALAETFIGTALVTGVFRKAVAAVTAAFLAFFTLLTLAILVFNPSMDCACFGQAIHLSHEATFIKNLVLCALWLLAFIPFSSITDPHKVKYVGFSVAVLMICVYAVYSLLSVPMFDFTPMTPGAELASPEELTDDPDAPLLSFFDRDYEYCDSVALDGDLMVISLYDPDRIAEKGWRRISEFRADCGIGSIVLASAFPSDDGSEGFYCADRRALMTLNRSNGGATLLRDGQIIGKWPRNHYPDHETVDMLVSESSAEAIADRNGWRRFATQTYIIAVVAFMVLL